VSAVPDLQTEAVEGEGGGTERRVRAEGESGGTERRGRVEREGGGAEIWVPRQADSRDLFCSKFLKERNTITFDLNID
jgi:hypothetical protein